jgi:hypothetical protein
MGNRETFTATKVPRQCPLVLPVKVGWEGGKTFGSGDGRGMESEARTEIDQVPIIIDKIPEFRQ